MEIFRKWGIYLSLFLTIVAFILMMAAPACFYRNYIEIAGIQAIFGDRNDVWTHNSPAALFAWIIGLLGILAMIALIGWSFLGGEIESRYKGIVELILAVGFVIAGILVFIVIPTYFANNGENEDILMFFDLSGGWIASGILYILSGLTIAIPGYLNFKSKY